MSGAGVGSSAEAFPREQLTSLIQGAESSRQRRRRLQPFLLGAAFALLALGLPTSWLWGDMELPRMVAGEAGGYSYGLFYPAARGLCALPLGAEQACFLLAALGYGASVPAMVWLLRTIGFSHAISMLSTGICLLSCLAWTGATLPSDFSMGLLGSTLLMRTMFQQKERITNGYMWRLNTFFLLALLLRPENLLLFPACLWAATQRSGRWGGATGAFSFMLVSTISLTILLGDDPSGAKWQHVGDILVAGGERDVSALLQWAVGALGGLGLCLFGLYSLLLGRRNPEESPPPRWVVPWCAVAIAPVAAGSPEFGPSGAFLLPAAAIGIADWLARRGDEGRAISLGLRMLLGQLAATVLLVTLLWNQDPLRPWRNYARSALEPSDLIIAPRGPQSYLATVRWGLEVIETQPASQAIEALGDRGASERRLVLFDSDLVDREAGLPQGMDIWLLTESSLNLVGDSPRQTE